MEKRLVLGQTSSTCKCCGLETDNLEKHLRESHGITGWDYWSIEKLRSDLYRSCQDCGSPRYLFSPVISGMYLPCLKCSKDSEYTEYITGKIYGLQSELGSSKIKQTVWGSGKIIRCSLDNTADLAVKILESGYKGKLLKDTYLGVYIKPGYPPEISERNSEGIGYLPIQIQVSKDLKFQIQSRKYQILLPESCGYDVRHHARYSILSDKAVRYTRRIRISGDSCYKFWNNKEYPSVKSIFRIIDPGTGDTCELSGVDLNFIRQIILRNKTTSDILWKIYNKVLKYTKNLEDWVLLRNTLPDLFPNNKLTTRITWTPDINSIDGVNISVL